MPTYLVTITPAEPFTRLVRAKTKAQAVAHVIDKAVSAEAQTPAQMYEHGCKQTPIEVANGE